MATNAMMRAEPQAAPYRPDARIAEIAGFLADPVRAAAFPRCQLRFRNDRWEKAVGLEGLTGEEWLAHFGRFEPLADNLPQPLALRYHGHQFRVYNPDLGDGRGFLFGQLRDGGGRLLDLGTKGSGTTPYSRTADGRLTLKGAVREILATEMLEALGVYTSKTFSVIETGEQLQRGDEPSPTRSAVLVRLSHSHIRIGSFQRLYALGETDNLAALVDYCLAHYPGPPPPPGAPGRDVPAVMLLHQACERLADLAAGYMAAGFVHGVLNTDNLAITGESFDYGPWRFLPAWDPSFTAAYFDHQGLYAFGRQPGAIRWNLGQLALSLSPLADSDALIAALERFGPLYQTAMARRFLWRLGVQSRAPEADLALVEAAEQAMRASGTSPDAFFFAHRGGRHREDMGTNGAFAEALRGVNPAASDDPYWHGQDMQSMLVAEVEEIWSAIAQHDDWQPLTAKIARLRAMGAAMGEPFAAQGHVAMAFCGQQQS